MKKLVVKCINPTINLNEGIIMGKRIVVFVIAALFFVGCKSTIKKDQAQLENSTTCCIDYSQVDFQKVLTEEIVLAMDQTSSILVDNGKRSYVKGIEISDEYVLKNVKLTSYFNGTFISDYFYPKIIIMDASKTIIKELVLDLTFYDASFGNPNAAMIGGFRVPEKAKFLAFVSKNNHGAKQDVFLNNDVMLSVSESPIGELKLTFY